MAEYYSLVYHINKKLLLYAFLYLLFVQLRLTLCIHNLTLCIMNYIVILLHYWEIIALKMGIMCGLGENIIRRICLIQLRMKLDMMGNGL